MVETMLAVIAVTAAFFCLFRLSRALTGKILVEHAAMRVARARAVGMNDFMCLKAARVAVIPAAGRRLWPEGDEFDHGMERARVPIYMGTPDGAVARGVLDYEGWGRLSVRPGNGLDSHVRLSDGEWFDLAGRAAVEGNCALYMNDEGR